MEDSINKKFEAATDDGDVIDLTSDTPFPAVHSIPQRRHPVKRKLVTAKAEPGLHQKRIKPEPAKPLPALVTVTTQLR